MTDFSELTTDERFAALRANHEYTRLVTDLKVRFAELGIEAGTADKMVDAVFNAGWKLGALFNGVFRVWISEDEWWSPADEFLSKASD